jgi:hypothetical protein
MENEGFYLTLLSNSSFNHYSENKTSNFKVHLSKEINLRGSWSVALTEISYPNTFHNVGERGNKITITLLHYGKTYYNLSDDKIELFIEAYLEQKPEQVLELELEIPIHHCDSLEDLVTLVNQKFAAVFGVNLFEESLSDSGLVKLNIRREGTVLQAIKLQGRLALQLGFTPEDDILMFEHSLHKPSLSFGLPLDIFIYIDIIEPQLISDICGQVIKIVKTVDKNTSFGESVHREIMNRNYLPLSKLNFQTISIQLRDNLGDLLPFKFGSSTIQLHFKKNALQNTL